MYAVFGAMFANDWGAVVSARLNATGARPGDAVKGNDVWSVDGTVTLSIVTVDWRVLVMSQVTFVVPAVIVSAPVALQLPPHGEAAQPVGGVSVS